MIEVVTVYTPRPQHEKWMDYLPLLKAQRASALKFGCRHTVVSDVEVDGFDVLRTELPRSLMHALIAGQIERLKRPVDGPILLLDADCLVASDPADAFVGKWDLAMTFRENKVSPINNGAMYVRNAGPALGFFERALAMCETHWGGDQEAISKAAAPVPQKPATKMRGDCLVAFVEMRKYAAVSKRPRSHHSREPYVIHFKGASKAWMVDYAAHVLGV